MEKKTAGIVATILSSVLCLGASVFLCFIGMFGITSRYNGDPIVNPALSVTLLCLAVLSLFVPVYVGFSTLRKKNDE